MKIESISEVLRRRTLKRQVKKKVSHSNKNFALSEVATAVK